MPPQHDPYQHRAGLPARFALAGDAVSVRSVVADLGDKRGMVVVSLDRLALQRVRAAEQELGGAAGWDAEGVLGYV